MMYGHDVEHRSNPVLKREYLDITFHEISEEVVYEASGLKVTAFRVEHDDGNPAFGYRIDDGRSVLLTADARYNESALKYGMNDNLIVSNVVAFNHSMTKAGVLEPVLNRLMTPEHAAWRRICGFSGWRGGSTSSNITSFLRKNSSVHGGW